jgi:hypothetical protein
MPNESNPDSAVKPSTGIILFVLSAPLTVTINKQHVNKLDIYFHGGAPVANMALPGSALLYAVFPSCVLLADSQYVYSSKKVLAQLALEEKLIAQLKELDGGGDAFLGAETSETVGVQAATGVGAGGNPSGADDPSVHPAR